MKVLLIGSGGRESAFAWKIAQSPLLTELFITPGNGGTSAYGNNEAIHETNLQGLADFALEYNIELIIVGPEAPLVEGIYDFFQNDATLKHIPIIGPSQEGAMLEGSKAFAKDFMQRHHIPTAAYREVTMDTLPEGLEFLECLPSPYVLKADGLAAGKGVLIIHDLNEARTELLAMLDGKFGDASTKVVIEEFMKGIEFSVFVLSDGINYKILPTAKDYKRIGEGDTGLNTGGMGAVSPPPFVTEEIMQQVEKEVIKPTIEGLLRDNIVYKGFIYIGLMLTQDGKAKVVEYNCRMGDPETEVVLPRIQTDILPLFISMHDGKLNEHTLDIINDTAVTVIMASGGYPEDYEKGKVITGIDKVAESIVFHCGTKKDNNGDIVSNGGRVLAVTSLGDTWESAVEKCYKSIQYIHFDQQYYRRDIGTDLK